MQVQLHNMHFLFGPNHIPPHVLFPLPPADDDMFENRVELYQVNQSGFISATPEFQNINQINSSGIAQNFPSS